MAQATKPGEPAPLHRQDWRHNWFVAGMQTVCCEGQAAKAGVGAPAVQGVADPRSDQPLDFLRGADEVTEQGMRREGLRFEFGMELDADEPRVIRDLDDLGKTAVR